MKHPLSPVAGLLSWLLLTSLMPSLQGQTAEHNAAAAHPAPDLANEKYGPHERNVLDFWKAKSASPTPLVVYIHGGGFTGGSKEGISGGCEGYQGLPGRRHLRCGH